MLTSKGVCFTVGWLCFITVMFTAISVWTVDIYYFTFGMQVFVVNNLYWYIYFFHNCRLLLYLKCFPESVFTKYLQNIQHNSEEEYRVSTNAKIKRVQIKILRNHSGVFTNRKGIIRGIELLLPYRLLEL